jgi:hypothetical protein
VIVVRAGLQLVALIQLQDPRLALPVARLDHRPVDFGGFAVVLVFAEQPRQLLVVLGRGLVRGLRLGGGTETRRKYRAASARRRRAGRHCQARFLIGGHLLRTYVEGLQNNPTQGVA